MPEIISRNLWMCFCKLIHKQVFDVDEVEEVPTPSLNCHEQSIAFATILIKLAITQRVSAFSFSSCFLFNAIVATASSRCHNWKHFTIGYIVLLPWIKTTQS